MTDTLFNTDFNFGELVKKFSSFCHDFTNDLCDSQPSHAVEFCSKVLYEIGPESSKCKGRDVMWRMKFRYQDSQSNHQLYYRTVIIATNRPVTYCGDTPECMCITVKEAGLLAMMTFNKLTDYAINTVDKKIMLTPLAGAVFLKKNIHHIATELNTPIDEIIKNINSSCQYGGEYLEESRLYIAIVAAIVSTRNKTNAIATRIIERIIKQYINKHKTMDDIKFNVYSKYAFYIPAEFIHQLINTTRSATSQNIQVPSSTVIPPTSHICTYAHGDISAGLNDIPQLINNFKSQNMNQLRLGGQWHKLSATSQSMSTPNIQVPAMGNGAMVIPPTSEIPSQTLKEGSPDGRMSTGPVVGATDGDSGTQYLMQMPMVGGLPHGTQQQHAGDLPLPKETTSSSTSDDLSQVAGADASTKSADEISLIETEIKELLL